jgi:hypothetical protein
MLADPLAIGASFVLAADMPAISREANKSVYTLTVSSVAYTATISHTLQNGRRRSLVRLDAETISASPFDSTKSVEDTTSVYLVIDRSERLVTDADVVIYVKELLGILDAAAAANVTTTRIAAIVQGQS